jgi:hypothetical protein
MLRGRYTGGDVGSEEIAARSDAESALEVIHQESPQEGDSGGTKILVKGKHLQLGEMTEGLVEGLAELAFSSVDPTPITKVDAFRRLALFLWRIRKFIQGLDYDERDICRTILAITKRKKNKGKMLEEPGANEKEILADFEARHETPPEKLADHLNDLASRKVLERKQYEFSGPFYKVIF